MNDTGMVMNGLLRLGWFGIVLLLGISNVFSQPVKVTGADGIETRIDDTSRIVTLANAVTEIVYALGMGDRVVGVDQSSLYPPEVQDKPQVGYFRQTSAEGILSLRPGLVIASEGLGPPAVAQQVRSAGVPVLILEEAHAVEAVQRRIRLIGQALGRARAADSLISQLDRDLRSARALQKGIDRPLRVLFIYARGAGVVQVAGRETSADAVLQLAGAQNVVTDYEGYRPITAESVVAAAPDVIVIPERGLESVGGVDGLIQQPGLALTPAGKQRRVIAVDDALLLSFGPRLGKGVYALTSALYNSKHAGKTD